MQQVTVDAARWLRDGDGSWLAFRVGSDKTAMDVCDCGKTRVVLAKNLKGTFSCGCAARRKADRRHGHPQPCWTCRNYAGGCSWSRKPPAPVKGWDATPTTKYQGNAGEFTPFAIHYCPEYVHDGTEVLMNG